MHTTAATVSSKATTVKQPDTVYFIAPILLARPTQLSAYIIEHPLMSVCDQELDCFSAVLIDHNVVDR